MLRRQLPSIPAATPATPAATAAVKPQPPPLVRAHPRSAALCRLPIPRIEGPSVLLRSGPTPSRPFRLLRRTCGSNAQVGHTACPAGSSARRRTRRGAALAVSGTLTGLERSGRTIRPATAAFNPHNRELLLCEGAAWPAAAVLGPWVPSNPPFLLFAGARLPQQSAGHEREEALVRPHQQEIGVFRGQRRQIAGRLPARKHPLR